MGWAFKKDTNDSRESAAIYVAEILIKSNISIDIYDPRVNENQILFDVNFINNDVKKNEKLLFIKDSPYDCIEDNNIVVILTEWDEFRDYDWDLIYKNMSKPAYILDGRNIMDKKKLESIGFNYIGIGR